MSSKKSRPISTPKNSLTKKGNNERSSKIAKKTSICLHTSPSELNVLQANFQNLQMDPVDIVTKEKEDFTSKIVSLKTQSNIENENYKSNLKRKVSIDSRGKPRRSTKLFRSQYNDTLLSENEIGKEEKSIQEFRFHRNSSRENTFFQRDDSKNHKSTSEMSFGANIFIQVTMSTKFLVQKENL